MYVKIGKYTTYWGPYQLADMVCFWCENYPEDDLHNRWDYRFHDWLGDFFAHGFDKTQKKKSWLYKLCEWVESKKKRKVKIHIDYWDTWNMDSTLSPIILLMLKQLKETKHGSGFVDLEDVPEHLRYTETEEYEAQLTFDFYTDENTKKIDCDIHTRYEWLLDELIWTFEQTSNDNWESQFWIEEPVIDLTEKDTDEKPNPLTWKVKGKFDYIGFKKHQERIDNGLKLFGKYFQTLWD